MIVPGLHLSRDQVRDIDRRATEDFGIPSIVLMENAGRGCAELMMILNPEKKPVVILCGPGNNGGDGFVIARHLENHGWPAQTITYDENIYADDAAVNYQIAESMDIKIDKTINNMDAWYVDALFGTGLTRALQPPYSTLIEQLNSFARPVLAIDLPSGLDCDTGEPLGTCVRATHTATMVAPKLGFKNSNSKQFTGEVHVIDIGAPRALVEQYS